MRRRKLAFGGSSALSLLLGIAVAAACNVYDSSLLTGGSEGQGGTSDGGEGSGGDSGTGTGGKGGSQGGGTGGASGTGGSGGSGGTDSTGGTGDTGGTGTGGSTGGTAGMTGGTGKGGTDPTGGDAGDTSTGGNGGSGAGSGGKGGTSAGDGGSGPSGGSGGGGAGGGSGGACGKCGCGKADTPDTDMDGILDCIDMCMGISDADCAVLKSGLVHRYSFNGTAASTAVTDTKGTAHGIAMGVNAGLSGSGTMVLTGGVTPVANDTNKQYVDLPDNLLTGLTNATFEAWVTWPGTTPAVASNWQRVFDFGTAATASAGAYVFLATRISSAGGCRSAMTTMGSNSETAAGGAQMNGPVISSGAHHFVVIVDDAGDQASLYVDGTLGSTVGFSGTIATLIGTNNWLGRSNFPVDPYFGGTFDEFRIYNVALTAAQLRSSRTAGPNATFF